MSETLQPDLPPPPGLRATPWRWAHTRLLSSPSNIAITLVCLLLLWLIVPPLLDWLVLKANFVGDSREACKDGGACWVFIVARINQFIYGDYPRALQWRVDLSGVLLIVLLSPLFLPAFKGKRLFTTFVVVVVPAAIVVLLAGGILGLEPVQTREWGGLTVTAFMTVYGALLSFPLGVLLALGRQSELPIIRTLCVMFIEFWRAAPIVVVIFLASLLLPLILPKGMDIDKLLRALIGLALVIAAYMAEAVRGGLQAVPDGQIEAAEALGLGYWRSTYMIVLPQALRASLPAVTNEFVSLVKNTTLVFMVQMLDLIGIGQRALADPKWVGLSREAYVFIGLVFWIVCYAISRWSAAVERRIATGYR